MNKTILVLVALLGLANVAYAQDKGAAAAMDPKMQEMMKVWKEYATPGAPHKMLAEMAGSWKYTSKMWETADGQPQESKGTAKMRMIMGGRYLENTVKGKAMGMDFEGIALTGYNNLSGKYESLWIDNMSTGMGHGNGSYDDGDRILKDSGQGSCPMEKDKVREYRSELKMVDKKNMTFSMWVPDASGKEYKSMEMVYTRK